MRPEYRAGMIHLALVCNEELESLCRQMTVQLHGTDTHLVYSDAMASAKIHKPEFLYTVDAWHPSALGHAILADHAFAIIHEQAQLDRWTDNASRRYSHKAHSFPG
jgi:hypothetical protein